MPACADLLENALRRRTLQAAIPSIGRHLAGKRTGADQPAGRIQSQLLQSLFLTVLLRLPESCTRRSTGSSNSIGCSRRATCAGMVDASTREQFGRLGCGAPRPSRPAAQPPETRPPLSSELTRPSRSIHRRRLAGTGGDPRPSGWSNGSRQLGCGEGHLAGEPVGRQRTVAPPSRPALGSEPTSIITGPGACCRRSRPMSSPTASEHWYRSPRLLTAAHLRGPVLLLRHDTGQRGCGGCTGSR